MIKSTIKKLNLGYTIGDEVTVDNEHIYGSYTQFVKLHRKYAPRFQYKTWEIEAKKLKVVGIHRHDRKPTNPTIRIPAAGTGGGKMHYGY